MAAPSDTALPPLDEAGVDVLVSVGDIVDDNRDHADAAETGHQYEAAGREWFQTVATEYDVPIVAVPGNHDPVDCTERLVSDVPNAVCAHKCVVDGSAFEQGSPLFEPFALVAMGCERFNLRDGFTYDIVPELNPANSDATDDLDYRARQTAERIESTFGRLLAGDLSVGEAATALEVRDARRDAFERCVETVTRRYERLVGLFDDAAAAPILVSHESPFFVEFDYHHQWDGPGERLHRGSLPLKLAIRSEAPNAAFCGHIHNAGRDAVETVDGYCQVLNLGAGGVAIVDLDRDAGIIDIRRSDGSGP
ncbi:calcineurin-like phosphoesterase family protein [Halopiger aswanensis]|uniref:Calcineurin-like phosphoesterase family protein n=2 Tax=Halopiger aswanensis TaxID=148449 RepID=A0A3R7D6U9_9EURY|nr:calcineurin-like phosphoesterase family protein [Halopiger aswanensis]